MNTGFIWGIRSRNGKESDNNLNTVNARRLRKTKGFTLVELIVVLVIVAILAAIAVPVALGFIDRAREKEDIADAEKSLSATQSVLNSVYNSAGNRVTADMRLKAKTDAGVDENTKFTVWTSQALIGGTTKATADNIGAYTVVYAEFTTKNGDTLYYDGKEWGKDVDITGKVEDGKAIYMWGTNGTDSASGEGEPEGIITWEDDGTEASAIAVTLVGGEGKLWFGDDQNKTTTYKFSYDGGSLELSYRVSRRYAADTLKWVCDDPQQVLKTSEIEGFLKDYKGDSVNLYATMDHATLSIPLTFTAANDNNITVTNGNADHIEYDLAMDYDIPVSGDRIINAGEALDTNKITYTIKNDRDEKQLGGWAVSGTPVTGDLMADVRNKAAEIANEYVNEGSTGRLDYKAYLEITKTVFVKSKTDGDVYFDNNTSSPVKTIIFTQTDLNTIIKVGDTSVYDIDGGEVTNNYSIIAGMAKPTEKQRLRTKWWHVADCDSEKGNLTNKDKVKSDAEVTEEVLDRLFADGGRDVYYELAEVDLANATTKFVPTNSSANWNNNGANPTEMGIRAKLVKIAGDDANKIQFIRYINKADIGNFGYTESSPEICLSTTKIQTASDTKLKKDPETGEYLIDGERDEEYPGYTVAYSVPVNGGYEIYVFTEDDSDIKVTGTCAKFNQNFKNMKYNSVVPRMDTSEVNDMRYMFAGCTNLKSISTPTESGVIDIPASNLDFSSLMNAKNMFDGCKGFTSANFSGVQMFQVEIGKHVEGRSLTYLFKDCTSLETVNFKDAKLGDIDDMSRMFVGCTSLETVNFTGIQTIIPDSTGSQGVHWINNMFENCKALKEVNISDLDANYVGDVGTEWSNVGEMFKGSGVEEVWMEDMHFEKITNLYKKNISFFSGSKVKTVHMKEFKADNLTSLNGLFKGVTTVETVDMTGLDVPKLNETAEMFYGCSSLSKVKMDRAEREGITFPIINASSMFRNCTSFTKVGVEEREEEEEEVYLNTGNFNNFGNMSYMFAGCTGLTEAKVNISSATNLKYLFSDCGEKLTDVTYVGGAKKDTPILSSISDMTWLYQNDPNVQHITIDGVYDNKISNLEQMFGGTASRGILKTATVKDSTFTAITSLKTTNGFSEFSVLEEAKFENVSLPKINDMSYMFQDCHALKDVSFTEMGISTNQWLGRMFLNCYSLENVTFDETFITKNVKDMQQMFDSCYSLKELDLSGFDTSGITSAANLNNMFGTSNVFVTSNGTEAVSNLKKIYALPQTETAFKKYPGQTAFGSKLTNLVGGDGTTIAIVSSSDDANKYKTKYGLIDGLDDQIGYFTNKEPSAAYIIDLKNGFWAKDLFKFVTQDEHKTITSFGRFSDETLDSITDEAELKQAFADKGYDKCYDATDKTQESKYRVYFLYSSNEHKLAWWSDADKAYLNKNAYGMFYGTGSIWENIKSIDMNGLDTSNVTNMERMFSDCIQIESIEFGEYFNTENVQNMKHMFFKTGYNNRNFNVLDVSAFDTSGITGDKMVQMFNCCGAKQILFGEKFTCENATSLLWMFGQCYYLQSLDLSGFDTGNVTNMNSMFHQCRALTTIYVTVPEDGVGFDVSKVTDSTNMFNECTKLVGGNGTKYNGSYKDKTRAVIDTGSTSGYFTDVADKP